MYIQVFGLSFGYWRNFGNHKRGKSWSKVIPGFSVNHLWPKFLV